MRKTENVTITDEGRDQGKVFVITEMPASQAERWATKAFLALAKAGIELPDNVAEMGMQGLAIIGFKALGGIEPQSAFELMDEMFASCLAVMPDPGKPQVLRGVGGVGPIVEGDIEEVKTRFTLRMKIFELHVGFSPGGVRSKPISATAPQASSNTPTSHAQSRPSSHAARHRSAS